MLSQGPSKWMRKTPPAIVGFDMEKGAMSQGSLVASEAGKDKRMDSPLGTPDERNPADILILTLWNLFWTSGLQKCKINTCGIILSYEVYGNEHSF